MSGLGKGIGRVFQAVPGRGVEVSNWWEATSCDELVAILEKDPSSDFRHIDTATRPGGDSRFTSAGLAVRIRGIVGQIESAKDLNEAFKLLAAIPKVEDGLGSNLREKVVFFVFRDQWNILEPMIAASVGQCQALIDLEGLLKSVPYLFKEREGELHTVLGPDQANRVQAIRTGGFEELIVVYQKGDAHGLDTALSKLGITASAGVRAKVAELIIRASKQ
jgi:hypothetical protein